VFCRELEAVIENTLGEETAAYNQSYRYPWFEPALLPDDTPFIRHVAACVRDVLRFEPQITTVSKQDSFVLTNHARIPTVSFGCTSRTTGRGAFHNPDEYIEIAELWDGVCVAYATVCDWLDAD
jgi:acetylornithine deacetylase/succinyl-diaminopimelate desuccinylase-like protein